MGLSQAQAQIIGIMKRCAWHRAHEFRGFVVGKRDVGIAGFAAAQVGQGTKHSVYVPRYGVWKHGYLMKVLGLLSHRISHSVAS